MKDGSYFLPDETVAFNGHTLTLAELQDLIMIAGDMGIGVEEAIFRYGWQTQFSEVAAELAARYPDSYAGAAIVDDGCGAWIAFNGPVPPQATGLVDSLPVPVRLIGERGFAEAELVEVLEEAYFEIYGHPGIANATGGSDIDTGVITIEAQPDPSIPSGDWSALCARLRPPQPANPAITIELILVEDLESGPGRTQNC
jgi:pimeloyl-ACP methyl ester carboxylesterase